MRDKESMYIHLSHSGVQSYTDCELHGRCVYWGVSYMLAWWWLLQWLDIWSQHCLELQSADHMQMRDTVIWKGRGISWVFTFLSGPVSCGHWRLGAVLSESTPTNRWRKSAPYDCHCTRSTHFFFNEEVCRYLSRLWQARQSLWKLSSVIQLRMWKLKFKTGRDFLQSTNE